MGAECIIYAMAHLAGVLYTQTRMHARTLLYLQKTQSDIFGKITQQMILLTDLHTLYELCAKMQIQPNTML